jgi:hypothetical protein
MKTLLSLRFKECLNLPNSLSLPQVTGAMPPRHWFDAADGVLVFTIGRSANQVTSAVSRMLLIGE